MVYLIVCLLGKKYLYANKPLDIRLVNDIPNNQMEIFISHIYIKNVGYRKVNSYAIFRIISRTCKKISAAKFKRRKRYRRIYGFHQYNIKISFQEWQKRKLQDH